MNHVTLNNQIRMPQLGLGVYKVSDKQIVDVVSHALKIGYRLIDTAQFYENERGVGEAIKKSALPREELFITTKVWNNHQGYDKTIKAFEDSLNKLGLDYLDLYLIHWPTPAYDRYVETYKALETLYEEGRVKAIGVSNFHIEHLERLLDECTITPVVNQVECHPYLQQKQLKAFCKNHHIYLESWSPLYRGGEVLEEDTIINLAKKYGKTAAQIVIRWHLQENSIVIPKSVTPSRIAENYDVFDFQLSEADMQQISQLDRNQRRGYDPNDMNFIEL